MARPSNTDERRGQIVGGLLSVMVERGFDGASVGRVARAAGLSPGLVHYHFQSKLEILLALTDELAARLRARAGQRARAATSARERLFALLDALVATGDDEDRDAVRAWVLIGAEALTRPEVRDAYQRVLTEARAELAQLVRAALVEEGQAPARAPAVAGALLAAALGAFQVAEAAPETLVPGSFARSLRQMAAGLLAGGEP